MPSCGSHLSREDCHETRIFFSVTGRCLLVVAAAQAPAPMAKTPTVGESGQNQVYGGFLYQPSDWGSASDKYYGFNVNYTHNFRKHWGGVVDFDWTRNNGSDVNDIDHGVAHNSKQYALRAGARYNLLTTRRFQPYLVVLGGGAHLTTLVLYPTRSSPLVQKNWLDSPTRLAPESISVGRATSAFAASGTTRGSVGHGK